MRLTPGHKLAPPEPPSIAPSLPTSQHSASRATSLRVGGPARPTQVSYRGNGSKDQGPCTSAIWRIFLVAKALPAVANFAELRYGEIRRTPLLRSSVNKAYYSALAGSPSSSLGRTGRPRDPQQSEGKDDRASEPQCNHHPLEQAHPWLQRSAGQFCERTEPKGQNHNRDSGCERVGGKVAPARLARQPPRHHDEPDPGTQEGHE